MCFFLPVVPIVNVTFIQFLRCTRNLIVSFFFSIFTIRKVILIFFLFCRMRGLFGFFSSFHQVTRCNFKYGHTYFCLFDREKERQFISFRLFLSFLLLCCQQKSYNAKKKIIHSSMLNQYSFCACGKRNKRSKFKIQFWWMFTRNFVTNNLAD